MALTTSSGDWVLTCPPDSCVVHLKGYSAHRAGEVPPKRQQALRKCGRWFHLDTGVMESPQMPGADGNFDAATGFL